MQNIRNPIADSLVLDVCRFCSCITPSICGNYGFQMNTLRYTSSEYHIQDQHLYDYIVNCRYSTLQHNMPLQTKCQRHGQNVVQTLK